VDHCLSTKDHRPPSTVQQLAPSACQLPLADRSFGEFCVLHFCGGKRFSGAKLGVSRPASAGKVMYSWVLAPLVGAKVASFAPSDVASCSRWTKCPKPGQRFSLAPGPWPPASSRSARSSGIETQRSQRSQRILSPRPPRFPSVIGLAKRRRLTAKRSFWPSTLDTRLSTFDFRPFNLSDRGAEVRREKWPLAEAVSCEPLAISQKKFSADLAKS
jgi:hypothetical protein